MLPDQISFWEPNKIKLPPNQCIPMNSPNLINKQSCVVSVPRGGSNMVTALISLLGVLIIGSLVASFILALIKLDEINEISS
jgi:hypothetical protein